MKKLYFKFPELVNANYMKALLFVKYFEKTYL